MDEMYNIVDEVLWIVYCQWSILPHELTFIQIIDRDMSSSYKKKKKNTRFTSSTNDIVRWGISFTAMKANERETSIWRGFFADENSTAGINIAGSRSSCRTSAWALFPSVVIWCTPVDWLKYNFYLKNRTVRKKHDKPNQKPKTKKKKKKDEKNENVKEKKKKTHSVLFGI